MLQDLRYALRSLRKRPAFTAVAVITLALGIGATTSVFSVVQGVLLRSLPFPHADRLVDIKSNNVEWASRQPGGFSTVFSLFEIWREDKADFEDMAATTLDAPVLTGLGPAERVRAPTVTANFFTLLGATPVLGRLFIPDDDRPGAPPIAVVSHRFWISHLGGDPHAIGRTITLDTTLYTIVGVTAPAFQSSVGPQAGIDLWLALGARLSRPEERNRFDVDVVGRLRPGVTPEQARIRLDAVASREWVPTPQVRGQGLLSVVTALSTVYVGYYRKPLLLMLAAVFLVLLIACANVSSLLISRAVERGPEMAVRLALGAGRRRLLLQVLAEAVMVSLAGGVLGLLLTSWLVPVLVAQAGLELPSAASISIDARVLAASAVVSLIAGVLSGLAPALLVSGERIADLLKASGGPGSLKRIPGARANDASLVVQAALTLMLLAGAGLMGRSFLQVVNLDLGFDPSHLLRAQISLPVERYRAPERRVAFIESALAQLRDVPGVSSAALASGAPMFGGAMGQVRLPGRSSQREPGSWGMGVTPDYFRTMGMPLVQGDDLQHADSAHVVVIDETAAYAFFPGENPSGKQITLLPGRSEEWTATVVGVVAGTTRMTFYDSPSAVVYYPLLSSPRSWLAVMVRTSGAPALLKRPVQEAIQRVDPTLAVDNVTTMSDWMSFLWARQRFYGLVLAVFAVFGLALAAAGLFGSASYAVAQRTRELGLRIALGADRRHVIALIAARGMGVALVGTVLGVFLALATTRVLRSLLYEVQPTDPLVLALVGGLLLAVCLLASYLPARRAASVDPMVALRAE